MEPAIFERAHTEALLRDLKRANTEAAKKERFLQYLTIAFAGDPAAQVLISSLSLGAERTIANIPRGTLLGKGRADSQTDTVIIEWERDLSKTGPHAVEQLKEYLLGNWRSGQEYRFVLVATDGVHWRLYAPDWSYLEQGAFALGSEFRLRETRRFDLTSESFSEFPFFLDEILFISKPKVASLEGIQSDFGDTSKAFINSVQALKSCARDLELHPELSVALDQWRRFLSIAYGRFDDSPQMFLVHTYLSVFAKLLAFAVLTNSTPADDRELHGVLTGQVFERLNVERFVEDDFFHWVANEPYFHDLRPMFRALIRQIGEYQFSEVREDILKGLYQELIDLDTRHALGEYYTPDWLCEMILDNDRLKGSTRVLDPACGSGSFLRAAVARIRQVAPTLEAHTVASQVVGIDIHPLSVQIAKTTLLLSLGSSIRASPAPVILHVYLANSLLVPHASADLFKTVFRVAVDNKQYTLDIHGVQSADAFDDLINLVRRTR